MHSENGFISAWHAVERLQRAKYESCWIITQPSHAVLAGDIAAKLRGDRVPKLDADIVRAIALHDAGWGMPDAQAVMRSRAVQQSAPRSFIQLAVPEFLAAWTQSVQVALSTSPAGGYIVSRHFWRLAEHRLNSADDTSQDRAKLQGFLDFESDRQKKLASKQGRTSDELQKLSDVLQFCDLVSLYLCCGARENVEFPEYFGAKVRISREDESYRVNPALVESGTQFGVAALRHPATKEESGREIEFRIL